MSLLGLAAALGTLLLLGGGLSALLLARKSRINLAEWFCLSWLFGVCAISLLLWLGGLLLNGIALESFVAATAILFAGLGRRAFARFRPLIRIPKPNGIVEWVLAIFLALQIGTIFVVSLKHTLGWDGLLIWELKARYAFLNGGVLPSSYFQGIGRSFSHLDYPLAIPFTQLWLYLWLGEANQFWAKIIFPIFYLAGAVLLALLGQRLTGRRWVGLVLAVLLFFVPQASLSTGSAIVGYADFPLAIYYLAAAGYLLCALRDEDGGASAPIFACCLACLPWIKNEGVILWAVIAGVGALLILTGRLPRRYFLALCPGFLVAASWRIFLHAVQIASVSDFLPINRETLPANLSRLPAIYRVILSEVLTVRSWGLFWAAGALTLLFLAFRWRYLTERLLLIFTVIPFGLYSGIYVLSAWHLYLDHVASSVPRLLMQLVPVILLGLGIALAEIASGGRVARPFRSKQSDPLEVLPLA